MNILLWPEDQLKIVLQELAELRRLNVELTAGSTFQQHISSQILETSTFVVFIH